MSHLRRRVAAPVAPLRPARRSIRPIVCAALAAVVLAACDSGTEPDPVQVILTGEADGRLWHESMGTPSVRLVCGFALQASLSVDEGSRTARWEGGRLTFRPLDGTAPWTQTLSDVAVQALWGRPGVIGGETARTDLVAEIPRPLDLEMELDYKVDHKGSVRSTTHTVTCAPDGTPLDGRYRLSTIDGARVPAASGFDHVNSASIEFFPDLTYDFFLSTSDYPGGPADNRRSGRIGYGIEGLGSYRLTYLSGTVRFDFRNDNVRQVGSVLFLDATELGSGPDHEWRFERF